MKPYGYVRADGSGIFIYGTAKFEPPKDVELVPVYLAREWVGLTATAKLDLLSTAKGAGGRINGDAQLLGLLNEHETQIKRKNT